MPDILPVQKRVDKSINCPYSNHMQRAFTCGHEHQEPRNMGRGMARERRLQAYFARVCLSCALKRVREQVQSLTDQRGDRMPDDYYARKEAEAVERVRRSY